jgi:hypothetical protein
MNLFQQNHRLALLTFDATLGSQDLVVDTPLIALLLRAANDVKGRCTLPQIALRVESDLADARAKLAAGSSLQTYSPLNHEKGFVAFATLVTIFATASVAALNLVSGLENGQKRADRTL